MPQTLITAGDAVGGVTSLAGGNDGTFALVVGPAGAKVTALTIDATGRIATPSATNAPTFSAYASALQSIVTATYTKVLFDTEEFDTNNNFAASRFTPTVPGYYQLTSGLQIAATTFTQIVFYKNGLAYKNGNQTPSINFVTNVSTALVFFNGTSDFVEVYATVGATNNTSPGIAAVFFQAFLARSA